MAKVEILGVVDVEQFHPLGDSDADTVVVQVKEIRVDGELTKQFEGAFVLDHGEPRALIRNGCVRVRLEGLDAPELHYPTTEPDPVARPNATFRQARGAACTKALAEALGGSGLIRARAVTEQLKAKRPGDRVTSLEGFLSQGTAGNETENLATFISDDSGKPRFTADPFQLAFVERAGTTYDAEGQAIEEFT